MDIFVFGSNLAGRHGKGSAREALLNWGATYGKGVGFHGRSYAIPTKDGSLRVLPIEEIAGYVHHFLLFANEHPEHTFHIVKIGCGLAGYSEREMAPLFRGAPPNCRLPEGWRG